MANSKIEWTEVTWNPTTGCSKISEGCKHCYAERMARRLHGMGIPKYRNGFNLTLHPEVLNEPLSWKNPRTVFVNSMSDLFHEKLPFEYIKRVFEIMNQLPQHTFQILTKRADCLSSYSKYLNWTKNIWMGVTVENNDCVNRIDKLAETGAFVKFVSMEPLLERIRNLNFTGIDWAIVGGESGPGARIIEESWVLEIKEQCKLQNTHFFFKQWGGLNKKKTGRILEGRTWDEMPDRCVNVRDIL